MSSIESIHPDPYHDTDPAAFRAAADELKSRLPDLTENEAVVALLRLYGRITTTRGEGHSHAISFPLLDRDHPMLPLHLWLLDGGLFIVDALAPHQDLIGTRVTAIGERPVDEVIAAVSGVVPRDHPGTVATFLPRYLVVPDLLEGLGLIDDVGSVSITVAPARARQGSAGRTVAVRAVPSGDIVEWKGQLGLFRLPIRPEVEWLARIDESSWWAERDGALVIQLNLMFAPLERLAEDVQARVADGGIERVILDMRHDLGGNYFRAAPLREALSDPAVDRPDRLFILTSRSTFSAGALLARDLEAATGAIFVGETLGGGLDFWADHRTIQLFQYPGRPLVNIPTEHWERLDPTDERAAIEPDVPVELTWADIAAGRDPAMEAILAR